MKNSGWPKTTKAINRKESRKKTEVFGLLMSGLIPPGTWWVSHGTIENEAEAAREKARRRAKKRRKGSP